MILINKPNNSSRLHNKNRVKVKNFRHWIVFFFLGLVLSDCQLASKSGPIELSAKAGSEEVTAVPQPESGPQAGRYQGLAQTLGSKRQFHISLDLAYVGGGSYRVFVKLSPGEEESNEFSSLFFVQGSLDKNRVIFKTSNPKDLWGNLEETGDQGFKGGFYSPSGNQLVDFKLTRDLGQKGERQPASTLSGYYQAKSCAAHLKGIFIEAFRESRDSPADQSPLRVSGRLVQKDSTLCLGKAACVAESYTSGIFEPFSGSLMLDGATQKRTCVFQKDVISCDIPCTFERSPDEGLAGLIPGQKSGLKGDYESESQSLSAFKKMKKIEVPQSPMNMSVNPYEGQYYGYVFHESLQTYQLFALNVETKAAKPPQVTQMLPVGALYFGEGDSSEFIAYSFLPISTSSAGQIGVLEGRGDGVLVLRQWKPDSLIGDWYSKSFGYVGPMILYRGIVPKLPQDSKMIQPLSASYLGGAWNLEITASSEVSEFGTAFYPLRIFGFAKEQIKHAKRRVVERGSYDFYTGQFLLRLDDHRSVVGHLQDDGIMFYWPPNPRVGTDMKQGQSILFKKFGTYPEPRAFNPQPKDQS